MHQLMTINGLFIYFVIPVFVGFSHIYFLKFYKKNNYILFFLLILSVGSTLYYGYKYVHKRDFMDLRNANIINAIDAQSIDYKLKGLKWITPIYPNNPKKEISNIKKAISIIKLDVENKMIITDYQFISPILSIYDFSPSQVWFDYHANPKKGTKYFSIYKKFFIDRIKEGDIVNVYSIKPLWGGKDIFAKTLSEDCLEKEEITDILDRYKILMCDDLKN